MVGMFADTLLGQPLRHVQTTALFFTGAERCGAADSQKGPARRRFAGRGRPSLPDAYVIASMLLMLNALRPFLIDNSSRAANLLSIYPDAFFYYYRSDCETRN
jgi:hypothetical protein